MKKPKRQSRTIEVGALLNAIASGQTSIVDATERMVVGLAEVGNRLGGVEKALSQHSFVTIGTDDGSRQTTNRIMESKTTIGPTMGYVDRLMGILDGTRETRRHLEAFMNRLGVLDYPPGGGDSPAAKPQSNAIRDLLSELNDERIQIAKLVGDLAQAF